MASNSGKNNLSRLVPRSDKLLSKLDCLNSSSVLINLASILFTIILAPVLNSFTIIFVFIQSKMKRKIFSFRILYDGFHFFKTWGFIEVYIIGVIVTYIKLTGMTSATSFDTGFYIMLFYLFIFYMSNKKFDIKSVLE